MASTAPSPFSTLSSLATGPAARWRAATIRVAVVDADEDMLLFLRTLLEQDRRFSIAGVAATGAGAVAIVQAEQPDAVVVELQIRDGDGFEAVGMLREAAPNTKIVVCSAFPDPYTLVDLLSRGADGYIDTGLAWSQLLPTLAGLCRPMSAQLG